jgi:hypothetical protein
MLGVAVLAAALAGCGDKGEATTARPPIPATSQPAASEPSVAQPSPSTVDACTLVSKVEAERLVGAPLNEAMPAHQSCTYTGSPNGPTAQVEVYVGDSAKKFYDIEVMLQHKLVALPGVGDEAHIEDGAVFFHKAGMWVAIRFVRLDDLAKYRTALESLARTVAGRI